MLFSSRSGALPVENIVLLYSCLHVVLAPFCDGPGSFHIIAVEMTTSVIEVGRPSSKLQETHNILLLPANEKPTEPNFKV